MVPRFDCRRAAPPVPLHTGETRQDLPRIPMARLKAIPFAMFRLSVHRRRLLFPRPQCEFRLGELIRTRIYESLPPGERHRGSLRSLIALIF